MEQDLTTEQEREAPRATDTVSPGRSLEGHLVVEVSAFVAAPYAGLVLAHLGAEVIRVDPVHGPPDQHRWPLATDGTSLFWSGLNAGKKSVRIDTSRPRGRELLLELLGSRQGRSALLTNVPIVSRMGGYERMREQMPELLVVEMLGNFDGGSEVDYTVQPATGLPWVAGFPDSGVPVNSPLPTWDLMLGLYGAIGVLEGIRQRELTGQGQHMSIALSDVAFQSLGALGRVAAAQLGVAVNQRAANDLIGGYGQAFRCLGGGWVMVVGLTDRQWASLTSTADPDGRLNGVCEALGVDLSTPLQRYVHRDIITAVLRPWFDARESETVVRQLRGAGVSCARYLAPDEVTGDWRLDPALNDLWSVVDQPALGPILGAGLPIRSAGRVTSGAKSTPRQAEHTHEVLASVLDLAPGDINEMIADGLIA
jgi:2-methylfumaryl-CoA isomerase